MPFTYRQIPAITLPLGICKPPVNTDKISVDNESIRDKKMKKISFLILLAPCLLLTSFGFASGKKKAKLSALYRLPSTVTHMKLHPKGKYLAYLDGQNKQLKILNLKTKQILNIAKAQVGGSYFWSPYGFRLFYRYIKKDTQGIKTQLAAYDLKLKKSVKVASVDGPSGLLTFDPRDLRLHLYYEKGILTRKIYFPGQRLASWQVSQNKSDSKFVATQKSILFLTDSGYTASKLVDDKSGIQSFDISPDGRSIVWATKDENIYVSQNGESPKYMAKGFDPQWHPHKEAFIFSGARKLGRKTVQHDIKLMNMFKQSRWLTNTHATDERWPRWLHGATSLIYTVKNTTDIFTLNFENTL